MHASFKSWFEEQKRGTHSLLVESAIGGKIDGLFLPDRQLCSEKELVFLVLTPDNDGWKIVVQMYHIIRNTEKELEGIVDEVVFGYDNQELLGVLRRLLFEELVAMSPKGNYSSAEELRDNLDVYHLGLRRVNPDEATIAVVGLK